LTHFLHCPILNIPPKGLYIYPIVDGTAKKADKSQRLPADRRRVSQQGEFCMKNKLKLLGIIAAVAIVGLTMISCGDSCQGGGDCIRTHDGSTMRSCMSGDCAAHMGDTTPEVSVIHCNC